MQQLVKKLKNYWYYYKVHTLIALAVAAAALFLGLQSLGRTEPDYHIGIVTPLPCREETLAHWQQRFADLGQDVNGDGTVTVQLHSYPVELGGDAQGSDAYQVIAQLDADLVGKMSGLFLLEDPQAFQQVTNGMLSETFLPMEDGLYLGIRSDAAPTYLPLFEAMK